MLVGAAFAPGRCPTSQNLNGGRREECAQAASTRLRARELRTRHDSKGARLNPRCLPAPTATPVHHPISLSRTATVWRCRRSRGRPHCCSQGVMGLMAPQHRLQHDRQPGSPVRPKAAAPAAAVLRLSNVRLCAYVASPSPLVWRWAGAHDRGVRRVFEPAPANGRWLMICCAAHSSAPRKKWGRRPSPPPLSWPRWWRQGWGPPTWVPGTL